MASPPEKISSSPDYTFFYYEPTDSEILSRVVCIRVRKGWDRFKPVEDDFDAKQRARGCNEPYMFGYAIFRNEEKQKNLPLRKIRRELDATARGRLERRPLFALLPEFSREYYFSKKEMKLIGNDVKANVQEKLDLDCFRNELRRVLFKRPVWMGIRVRP
jgi:hypothetical protein